jgi:hypothetical protein
VNEMNEDFLVKDLSPVILISPPRIIRSHSGSCKRLLPSRGHIP